jgi:hypothetical protein
MARLDDKTLAMLLQNVDESALSEEQKALLEQTKKSAEDAIERAELAEKQGQAEKAIRANVRKIVDRDYVPMTIPACAKAVLLKFVWDSEADSFVADDIIPTFAGEAPTDELLTICQASGNLQILSKVLNLDDVLLDDFSTALAAALAFANNTDSLLSGEERINAVLAYADWPATLEVLQENVVDTASFTDGVDFDFDDKATIEIVYNSAEVNEANNEGSEGPAWFINVKFGKSSSGGNGRKSSPRATVEGYSKNLDYAKEHFIGKDAAYYDERLTQLDAGDTSYNLSKELLRIEKANPAGPQEYTKAKEAALVKWKQKESE